MSMDAATIEDLQHANPEPVPLYGTGPTPKRVRVHDRRGRRAIDPSVQRAARDQEVARRMEIERLKTERCMGPEYQPPALRQRVDHLLDIPSRRLRPHDPPGVLGYKLTRDRDTGEDVYRLVKVMRAGAQTCDVIVIETGRKVQRVRRGCVWVVLLT